MLCYNTSILDKRGNEVKKVLVAMSGGIDSTVTAWLLQRQGYEIEGVYFKLHDNPAYHEENICNVKLVADYLGIPYRILDLQERFLEAVYRPFVETYQKGLTPNPCVLCNRTIKLGAVIDYARAEGFDALATGHYAQIEEGFITQAVDLSKDQSYFLANVRKEALEYVIFPLGGMLKEEVRKLASSIDILKSFATKKESSEICFVESTYLDILKKHTEIDRPGEVVDSAGNVIGTHKGYMHYTIGKRRGFQLHRAHEPHYVTAIDAEHNRIVVGKKAELDISEFYVEALNLFIETGKKLSCEVKIRYRSPQIPCEVTIEGDSAIVRLKEPVQGLAPGQAAVFYDGRRVIGSGWITIGTEVHGAETLVSD
ncbi:MAG: tRNA 2-thiouridine(34) synthase MnmA [Campylobacteraceae bacterium 4484_4]|nr:MAG: tRNA 2-thiouridine(34) synthase MnmA [Campylobacteraceae bacterium 4484_4]